jgi:hypothetical protein
MVDRTRGLLHEVAGEFFRAVVEQARALKLLSDEHFTVDGRVCGELPICVENR